MIVRGYFAYKTLGIWTYIPYMAIVVISYIVIIPKAEGISYYSLLFSTYFLYFIIIPLAIIRHSRAERYFRDISVITRYKDRNLWVQDLISHVIYDSFLFSALCAIIRYTILLYVAGWPGWTMTILVVLNNSVLCGLCILMFSLTISTISMWLPSRYVYGLCFLYIFVDFALYLNGTAKLYIPQALYNITEINPLSVVSKHIPILLLPIIVQLFVIMQSVKRVDFIEDIHHES